jgi:nodulation protein E
VTDRVVVTGCGAVSAFGLGMAALWRGLCAGHGAVRPLTVFTPQPGEVTIGAELSSFDAREQLGEAAARTLDRFAAFAVIAAREAVRDAGLQHGVIDRRRAGVSIGSALGGLSALAQMPVTRPVRAHPLTIPRSMHNAATARVSMDHGYRGPALCHATACASGAHAIGEAAEAIRAGRADVMLAGGSDAPLTPEVLGPWQALRLLAPPDPEEVAFSSRAFSAERKGFVMGEGAAVVVLESEAHARQRGARARVELAGYGASADALDLTQPSLDGPVQAIEAALAQARLAPVEIAYVNAHGTGTQANDRIESAAIRRVFLRHADALAVSATKPMHGHAMGASPALELVATVRAMEESLVPPTIGWRRRDPDCDLDYVPNEARAMAVPAALSHAFAFGGLNAVLALRRLA